MVSSEQSLPEAGELLEAAAGHHPDVVGRVADAVLYDVPVLVVGLRDLGQVVADVGQADVDVGHPELERGQRDVGQGYGGHSGHARRVLG